jgi:hypothetical protein
MHGLHHRPARGQVRKLRLGPPARPITAKPPDHPPAQRTQSSTHPSARAKRRTLRLRNGPASFRQNDRRSVDRLSPVRRTSAPNASVRRSRPSRRPTRLRRVGSASIPCLWRGETPMPAIEWRREVARPALSGTPRPALSGTRPSFDGRDLAVKRVSARDPLRLCGSAPLRFWVGGLCGFALKYGVSICSGRSWTPSASICVICGF